MNCHSPSLLVKAVFSLSLISISTCQYPLLRSRVENRSMLTSRSKVSSILVRGVRVLPDYSTQPLIIHTEPPSFSLFRTTGEAHGLVNGSISPCLHMSVLALCTSPFLANGRRHRGCRMGAAPSVSMQCVAIFIFSML